MKLIDRKSLYDAELGEEIPMETLFSKQAPYCSVSLPSISSLLASVNTTVPSFTKPLKFIYLKDVPHQKVIASEVIANLYEAGIPVEVHPMEKDDYNAAMDSWLGPNYDKVGGVISFDIVYTETWGPSYDAISKLYDATYDFGSGEADAVVTSNLKSLSKVDLTKFVFDMASTADDTKRQELYTDVLTRIHNEAIFLPLTAKRNIAVVNRRVSGFEFGTAEYNLPIEKLYPTSPVASAVNVLSTGGIAGIAVLSVAVSILAVAMLFLIQKERHGKPYFLPLVERKPAEGEVLMTRQPVTVSP